MANEITTKPRFVAVRRRDVPRIVKDRLNRGWMNKTGWRVVVRKREGMPIGQYAALVEESKGRFVAKKWFYAELDNG